MKPLTVGVLTFNTSGIIYSSKNKGPHGLIRNIVHSLCNDFCQSVDINFIDDLKKTSITSADVIAILLQESSIKNPKTCLISDQFIHAISDNLKNTHFLYSKTKQYGVGKEGLRGLRIGILISNRINKKYISHAFIYYNPVYNSNIKIIAGQHMGKGSICVKLLIKGHLFAIMNSHFPFHGNLSDQGKFIRDITFHETMQYYANNNIENIPMLFCGDLNYRVQLPLSNITETSFDKYYKINITETYKKYDELYKLLKTYDFSEGVNNKGINFMPTSKLVVHNRLDTNFSDYKHTSNKTKRFPSWTDRILYKYFDCIFYDRFDSGNIKWSDHAAVLGLFILNI
jgi:hypothetical protein